jgi:bacillithiol biosynthesis cysteine-adding enzyme BshC
VLYKNIPAAETKLFSKLVLDYIQGKDFVKSFYNYPPVLSSFDEVFPNRHFDSTKRSLLREVLLEQYAKSGISQKDAKLVYENIEQLKDSNTYTITTGHQLAIFTGPLFFIYKIITTIRLIEELKLRYPDKHFVPVFWMASEDHDFVEINHVYVKGQKLEWLKDSGNQPVGRLLTDGMQRVIEQLKLQLGTTSQLVQLFEKCYSETNTLSDATIKLVHALFGEQGLVILEPDNKALKQQFTTVMRDDVLKHSSFKALIDTNGQLDRQYKLQITGREINFFYLSDAGRNLIFKTTKGFEVQHTDIVFSEAEIEKEIEQHPERFSPNVVLRPVYQECILPNLAYVGGPGEIAYWLQLKGVFAAHSIPYPLIVLRNSVLLLPQSSIHKLEKRKVLVEQLFEEPDVMVKDFVSKEHPISLTTYSDSLCTILQAAIDNVMPFDNKIASQLIALKKKTVDELERQQKDLLKSKKVKSENDIEILKAIRNELFPDNQPQERYDTLISFAANYPEAFLSKVNKSVLPLSHTVDIMVWD